MTKLARYERAYIFFSRMEAAQRAFTLDLVRRKTGWKISTIESYRTKKWSWFLVSVDRPGYFLCRGLLSHSKEQFIDLHRQKRVPVSQSVVETVKEAFVPVYVLSPPLKIDQRAWIVIVVMMMRRILSNRKPE